MAETAPARLTVEQLARLLLAAADAEDRLPRNEPTRVTRRVVG